MSEPQQLDMIRGMVRRNSPRSSVAAAHKVAGKLSDLQYAVIGALSKHGPMTAGEIERLAYFVNLAPSTARKRVSELRQLGRIADTGARRDGMIVWRLA